MIKPGGLRSGIEYQKTYTELPVTGLVATDGVQYSSVATFGTTAVEILNTLIDPGYTMALKRMEFQAHHRFVGLNGSFVGSVYYYWEARTEAIVPSGGSPMTFGGAWVNITGTYQVAVPTLATLTGTYLGYANLGSLPFAPVRLRLMARGVKAAVSTGEVKSSTYIHLVGNIVPGT